MIRSAHVVRILAATKIIISSVCSKKRKSLTGENSRFNVEQLMQTKDVCFMG